ncbi:E3 SUMO-protein ligase pli1, partial [Lachnellula suecica]
VSSSEIRLYHSHNDSAKFERLKTMIYNPASISAGGMGNSASPARSTPAAATPASYLGGAHAGGYNMGGGNMAYRAAYGAQQKLDFKPSPFFKVEQQLGETLPCEGEGKFNIFRHVANRHVVMPNHRHTVKATLRVQDHPLLHRVHKEESLRVMVFCAQEDKPKQDIAFPHQSEVKVNGGEVKANLRGLKNKPGSTRPVDITKELRLNIPAYGNSVEMTYALTSKAGGVPQSKFYLAIYVVKVVPVTELVEGLKIGKRITEKSVLDDMGNKARDADIIATASVLSLKCPLSTLRIDLPCRSTSCRHNQCFDATSYLQLQEQGPTWLCPICNNSAPFESLAVDEYVKGILKATSRSTDQVIVQPDGKWGLNSKKENMSRQSNGVASDDDDDLVEVTRSGDSVRMGTPRSYGTTVGTAARPSASSSVAPRDTPAASSSGKRPAATVIDLTSSGDEDDEPLARPPKRQQTNGYTAMPPAYQPPTNGY